MKQELIQPNDSAVPSKSTRANAFRVCAARVACVAIACVSLNAHAGGLSAGTTAVTDFEVWFYALAGIAAICYLVWVGVQCWSNKADWISDFGGAVAKVAAVGSVTVLAPWAWSVFS